MDEKLEQLGLETYELVAEHKRRLDEDGFTVFEDVIDEDWLNALRQAFEQAYDREGADAGKEVAQMEGVRRLADLVNKGEAFDQVYLQPFLLAAVGYVLQQPFKLHSVNGHDPKRGNPPQALHADWGGERDRAHVVNSMWMLDDFTVENGATRIVPGSHRDPRKIKDIHPDRPAPFPVKCALPERPTQSVFSTAMRGMVRVRISMASHDELCIVLSSPDNIRSRQTSSNTFRTRQPPVYRRWLATYWM